MRSSMQENGRRTVRQKAALPDQPIARLASLLSDAVSETASPEQAAFHAQVAALEAERARLQAWQQFSALHLRRVTQELNPLLAQVRQQQTACLHGLDHACQQFELSQGERRLAQRQLCQLASELLVHDDSAAIKALYNQYSGADYDAEQAEAAEALRERMVKDYGIDMSQARGDTPEEMLEHARDRVLHAQARTARKRNERRERQQTPRQQAQAGAQRERAAQTQASIREVYRKLASALHPDRETDATLREHKTALMARVNQAYDRKDLLLLLELQLELVHIDAPGLNRLPAERLRAYHQLLQSQLAQVQRETAALVQQFRLRYRLAPLVAVQPAEVALLLDAQISQVRQALTGLLADAQALQDPARFKAWVRADLKQRAPQPGAACAPG